MISPAFSQFSDLRKKMKCARVGRKKNPIQHPTESSLPILHTRGPGHRLTLVCVREGLLSVTPYAGRSAAPLELNIGPRGPASPAVAN